MNNVMTNFAVFVEDDDDLKLEVGAILHPVEASLNQSFNGSHVGSTNSAGINDGAFSNGGGRGNRLEWKTLPKFDGDIGNYVVFKASYQARMVADNVDNEIAAQWLGADCVMTDKTLQTALVGMSYEEQWQMLDSRYSSEVLATQRAMKPVLTDGKKQLKYGPELVKYVIDLTTCYKYIKKLENQGDAWFLLSVMQQCNGYLPDKVSEDIKKEVAKMQKAEPLKVIEIIEMFSKMEPPKVVRQAANIVHDGGRNNGGGRGYNGGGNRRGYNDGNDKKLICVFCSGNHMSYSCAEYKAMTAEERLSAVTKNKMCQVCLSPKHLVQDHKLPWECRSGGCKMKHHFSLHAALSANPKALVTYCHQGPAAHLGLQLVKVHGVQGVILWDGGANCNLVTKDYVKEANLQIEHCNIQFDFGGANVDANICCRVPLVDNNGDTHIIIAAIVDQIAATNATGFPANKAATEFGEVVNTVFDSIVDRPIDILIGVTDVVVNPREISRNGSAYLYESLFGSGYFVKGTSSLESVNKRAMLASADVCKVKAVFEFLEGEKLGVVAPKRCEKCAGCRDCSYRNEHLTWLEQFELEKIEEGLRYLPEKKQWICKYPLFEDVTTMPNNYNLCVQLHHKLVERLNKNGYLQKFDGEFRDAVNRGVFVEMTDEDKKYQGMVNYIPMVEALKEKVETSTPVRVCMNSSMKYNGTCLNDVMCKGPSALSDQYGLLVRFRCHRIGLVLDIKKFYNSILSVERDQHLRRVLWSPVVGEKPVTYLTTTVNFGDRPAGCVVITALRKTAEMFGEINPVASKMLIEDTYVDDVITGVESKEEGLKIDKDIREIGEKGSFKFKPAVMTGDDVNPQAVLGIEWCPNGDDLSIKCKVNVSVKKKGVRVGQDLDLDLLMIKLPDVLTMREVYSIIMAQFDPLGLIGPITLQMKLVMRRLAGGGSDKASWDRLVPDDVNGDFKKVLMKLKEARELKFQRSIIPGGCVGKPSLVIFCDGSQQAYCALVYVRWETTHGVKVFFLTGKTRVGPLNQITVVRMELNASVLAARLCASVKKAVNFEFENEYFFTDSTATLGLIKADSGSLATYGGNRVGEIRSLTNFEDWYWVATDQQVADIGTRSSAVPKDLEAGTRYQDGPEWLKLPANEWPVKKVVGVLPREELSTAAKRVMCGKLLDPMVNTNNYEGFDKAVKVLARVMEVVEVFKGKRCKPRSLSKLREVANNHLFSWHQGLERSKLDKGDYKELVAEEVNLPGFKDDVKVVIMTGRTPEMLRVGYDRDFLVLVSGKNPLAAKILRDSHLRGHGGIAQTVDRSRHSVWITGITHLAKSVVKNCAECSLNKGKMCGQKMSALPPTRCLPSPPFSSVALDIFGPMSVKDFVKRRTSRKSWGLMIVCQATGAVAMEVMESYSKDSFLMAFRRAVARNGTPINITSDVGTQLTAAAKELPKWDWSQMEQEVVGRYPEVVWKFVPTGTPHMNGQAERHIGLAKKLLSKQLVDRNMTYGELSTVFDEVVNILNTKPYATDETDPATGSPLTPQHLLGARGNVSLPGVVLDEKIGISKRFQFVQRVINDFWRKYMLLVFPQKIKLKKWKSEEDGLKEGDVVQLLDTNMVSRVWKLARVTSTVQGRDGLVRKVNIKIAGTGLKEVEVGVQRLRLVYRPAEK